MCHVKKGMIQTAIERIIDLGKQ